MGDSLQAALVDIETQLDGVSLACTVLDIDRGCSVSEIDGDSVRSTASVGKLLLLIEVAERAELDERLLDLKLERLDEDLVADSGLWQHLTTSRLSVSDLAVLVASVSDNLATNVLLRHLGLDSVIERARHLNLRDTRLHDRVRNARTDNDPLRLSSGSTNELSRLMQLVYAEGAEWRPYARVLGWLRTSVDHSMVGSCFALDPLAHMTPDRGYQVINKTGTDDGVRADVGVLRCGERALAYAAIANWIPMGDSDETRDVVMAGLRDIGVELRRYLGSTSK